MADVDLNELGREGARYFEGLQGRICAVVEELERRGRASAGFCKDRWQHPSDGGGITRVLVDGAVFEKAGVNYSEVRGSFSEELAASMPGKGTAFAATGISVVIHPRNPYVPTVHANFRHICKGSREGRAAWFGGGSDLTPYYPRREDVIHFHRTWKEVCERHCHGCGEDGLVIAIPPGTLETLTSGGVRESRLQLLAQATSGSIAASFPPEVRLWQKQRS